MPKVIIIGGNHGLGLAWTNYYLSQGWDVVATYRDESASTELFTLKENIYLSIIKCDVTKAEDFKALAEINDINLVIYNAGTKGYSKRFAKAEEHSVEELDNAYFVNTRGLFCALKTLTPKLMNTPYSMFVYMSTGVSSTADNLGGGYLPYRSTKQAGNSIIRTWDIRLAEQCIELNKPIEERPLLFAMSPGLIDIGMGANVKGAMPVSEAIAKMVDVMNMVYETNDTHALWTYNKKRLESYSMPTVINEYKGPINEDKKEILHAFGHQSSPTLREQLLTLTVEEDVNKEQKEKRTAASVLF